MLNIYMNTNIFQNKLLKKYVVSAQPGINLNDLKELENYELYTIRGELK